MYIVRRSAFFSPRASLWHWEFVSRYCVTLTLVFSRVENSYFSAFCSNYCKAKAVNHHGLELIKICFIWDLFLGKQLPCNDFHRIWSYRNSNIVVHNQQLKIQIYHTYYQYLTFAQTLFRNGKHLSNSIATKHIFKTHLTSSCIIHGHGSKLATWCTFLEGILSQLCRSSQ